MTEKQGPDEKGATSLEEVQRRKRDARQRSVAEWAALAFGREEATSIPQRGLRLLEETIEAYQACGCDEAKAHELVRYVFSRPKGEIGQELGGVAVTTLALAAAAGVSADTEECREIARVLSKPLAEFAARNAAKNAAGFLATNPPPVAETNGMRACLRWLDRNKVWRNEFAMDLDAKPCSLTARHDGPCLHIDDVARYKRDTIERCGTCSRAMSAGPNGYPVCTHEMCPESGRVPRAADLKHGPGGLGGPGPCDRTCLKCALELKAAEVRRDAALRAEASGRMFYKYTATWSDDVKAYVGLCAEFPSLSWLADSATAARAGIIQMVTDVVKDMEENGEVTPPRQADQHTPTANHVGTARAADHVPPNHRQGPYDLPEASDGRPTAYLYIGDASWHDGAGWYYVDDDCADEGSVGAFVNQEDATRHAKLSGYQVKLSKSAADGRIYVHPSASARVDHAVLEGAIADLQPGKQLRYGDRHHFIVMLTDLEGIHTSRPRYLVVCQTCESLVHEATTGPVQHIDRHLREHPPAPSETFAIRAFDIAHHTKGSNTVIKAEIAKLFEEFAGVVARKQ